MDKKEMPVGFAMASAMNEKAMEAFSSMDERKKQEIIAGTHRIGSGEEMHQYVDRIGTEK